MKLVIVMQMILSALYCYTGAFTMTVALWLVYIISNLSLLLILFNRFNGFGIGISSQGARIIFTASLFLLELLIVLQPMVSSTHYWLGLINDAEVLVTGLLLGLLWHEKFK